MEKLKWLKEYLGNMGLKNIKDLEEAEQDCLYVDGCLRLGNFVKFAVDNALSNPNTKLLDFILDWIDDNDLNGRFPFIFEQACDLGAMHNVVHMLELKQQKYRGIGESIDLSSGLPILVRSVKNSLSTRAIKETNLCQNVLSDAGIGALNMLLKEENIDINAKDKLGNTATHYAVAYGDVTALKIILPFKPDLSIKNEEGKTAKDILLDRQKAPIPMDDFSHPAIHIPEQKVEEFRNANASMQELLKS